MWASATTWAPSQGKCRENEWPAGQKGEGCADPEGLGRVGRAEIRTMTTYRTGYRGQTGPPTSVQGSDQNPLYVWWTRCTVCRATGRRLLEWNPWLGSRASRGLDSRSRSGHGRLAHGRACTAKAGAARVSWRQPARKPVRSEDRLAYLHGTMMLFRLHPGFFFFFFSDACVCAVAQSEW